VLFRSKIAIAYWLTGYGVPYTNAADIATNFVDSGIKAKYTELGLTVVPNPSQNILRNMYKIAANFFE